MFKTVVLLGFIVSTAIAVQKGYDALLVSLDSYIGHSYGVLAESDTSSDLQKDASDITTRYKKVRSDY